MIFHKTININKLKLEIAKSSISDDSFSIISSGTGFEIIFEHDLSPEETDVLNDLVSVHNPIPPEKYGQYVSTEKMPVIYDLIKEGVSKPHQAIDYKNELIDALIPKRIILKGEVTQVTWYRTMGPNNTPENPVIRVEIVYTRDAIGFALSRTTTRTWINRDGSDNPETKVTTKYYYVNFVDQIQEGIKRRRLLLDSVQIPVLGLIMATLMPIGYSQIACLLRGRKFMDDYEGEFNRFIQNSSSETDSTSADYGKKNVVIKLENESDIDHSEWLDKLPPALGGATTIRAYLISEFTI
jgi:hypothetical protein